MKQLFPLLLAVMAGCTTIERDDQYCVEYWSFEVLRQECTGGRGVAPELCIVRPTIETQCIRWESHDLPKKDDE